MFGLNLNSNFNNRKDKESFFLDLFQRSENKTSQKLLQGQIKTKEKILLLGNKIPKNYFVTSGVGQSDITIHAGSYHLALKDAGIHRCNIITYSSILPAIATEIEKPNNLVHGSVLETIMACANAQKGQTVTAGIIVGWLYSKITGKKHGGLVCEYSGNGTEEEAKNQLQMSLNELHESGLRNYDLRDIEITTASFIPTKNFGTAIVALCFVNYVCPAIEISKIS